ncbi:MAG: hypothetical protein IJ533_02615, partial [Prevotella sp.]|nr:hypothetical protein [Prevotella sp.]
MKKTMILLAAMLVGMAGRAADEVTVADVTVPQGGQATVSISLANPDKSYTAGQMLLTLPEGVTAVLNGSGDPITAKGERIASTNHAIGATHLEDGTDQFTVFSISSDAIAGTEGTLFTITVSASSDAVVGMVLEGRLESIEMTTTDAAPIPFNNQTFNITIGENRIVLDETATTEPAAETDANVRVRRTIKAGEWSTICLPFSMTASQVTAAFGTDVKIGDFKGCDVDDETGNVKVKFSEVTAMEANHPYIIKVGTDVTEFTVDGVDIEPDDAEVKLDKSGRRYNSFIGNYKNGTVLEDGTMFLSGNSFNFSSGQTKIKGFRGYFDFAAADVYYE